MHNPDQTFFNHLLRKIARELLEATGWRLSLDFRTTGMEGSTDDFAPLVLTAQFGSNRLDGHTITVEAVPHGLLVVGLGHTLLPYEHPELVQLLVSEIAKMVRVRQRQRDLLAGPW